jgi:hypothetical protein
MADHLTLPHMAALSLAFFPALLIASTSLSESFKSPAAIYPLIRDSVWEVVIGATLTCQSFVLPEDKEGKG